METEDSEVKTDVVSGEILKVVTPIIVEVILISHDINYPQFHKKLSDAINNLQAKKLTVDVQYQQSDRIMSALVIGKGVVE